jgi:signal transduction histidine kinase/ActR/RegA family two-component response regulator
MASQRSIAQLFLALQAALTACLAVVLSAQHDAHASALVAASTIFGACYVAYSFGWEPARQVAVVALTLLLITATREPYLTERAMMAVLVPPIVALVLTSARLIVASAVLGVAGLAVRSHFRTPLLEPLDLLVLVMCVSGLVLARLRLDTEQARSAAQVGAAELARERAEAAARDAIAEQSRAAHREQARQHAQRLESVGRLAGGVAHDFNNLLTVIGASASMAERAVARDQAIAADLEEIQLAVGRAAELTKQLLALARKQVLTKRCVELNQLVANVEHLLRRLIGEPLRLCTQLSDEPLRVMADAGQLEQVLLHLVINARDAITGAGSIEICTHRVGAAERTERDLDDLPEGEYACIEVKDSGIGMSDEVQGRLFEPFFTTKAAGRGLGLATSFGIVRQHAGGLRVESKLGRGTTMRVLLPLASAGEQMTSSGIVAVATARRVLVVEDEPQVRAIAARALTAAGFEVTQAPHGAAALSLVKEQAEPFAVIVTDVVMPELSGLELARAVTRLGLLRGLVFMSGFPEAMHGAHPNEFAGAVYLMKPFSAQALVDAVRAQIEHDAALRRPA